MRAPSDHRPGSVLRGRAGALDLDQLLGDRYLLERRVASGGMADVWAAQEVGVRPPEVKRFHHPGVGPLELACQTLLDPEQSHRLLVYTAAPGSDSYDKLQVLAAIGASTPP